MLAINLDHIDAGTANTKTAPSRPSVPCRPSRAGSLEQVPLPPSPPPSSSSPREPSQTAGRLARPAICCWNVWEGAIASRQHPREPVEPVSRVVDPPSSSRRRHHPPVESKTSLPLPKNPTVSSQASRRPGARHPCFFFPRSVARPRHLGECNAPWLPRPSPHSTAPRPPTGSPLSPCRWRWQLQLSQSAEWFHRARPARDSRGRFSAGAPPAPCELGQEAFSAAAHSPLTTHWCCSCCLVLPACVLLRAACCVLCLKTLNDSSTRLLFFPFPTPPRVLTRQPLFFLHTRPLCCQAATPS